MKEFDIENWYRKSQYEFFKTYKDPFFNITSNLDVTNLYNYCKENELSFSLACIYIAVRCVNQIEEFKLRIYNNKVVKFDEIKIGSTVLNDDNTFSFCYFNCEKSIKVFDVKGKKVIEDHQKGIDFDPALNALDLVHCSTLPWISFTGFKHARKGDEGKKGIPKLVFGKYYEDNDRKKIAFSVEVHHALMDGYHVALLFEKMQNYIQNL